MGWTGLATFDGQSLEPLDGRWVLVDMNLNRYLDHRESVDQAVCSSLGRGSAAANTKPVSRLLWPS